MTYVHSTLNAGRQDTCKISCDFFTSALEGLQHIATAARLRMIWRGINTRRDESAGVVRGRSNFVLLSPAVSLTAAKAFSAIRIGGEYQTHHRIQLLVDTHETCGLEHGTAALLL